MDIRLLSEDAPLSRRVSVKEGLSLIPRAHTIDIIIRRDGREYSFEGDWLKEKMLGWRARFLRWFLR